MIFGVDDLASGDIEPVASNSLGRRTDGIRGNILFRRISLCCETRNLKCSQRVGRGTRSFRKRKSKLVNSSTRQLGYVFASNSRAWKTNRRNWIYYFPANSRFWSHRNFRWSSVKPSSDKYTAPAVKTTGQRMSRLSIVHSQVMTWKLCGRGLWSSAKSCRVRVQGCQTLWDGDVWSFGVKLGGWRIQLYVSITLPHINIKTAHHRAWNWSLYEI